MTGDPQIGDPQDQSWANRENENTAVSISPTKLRTYILGALGMAGLTGAQSEGIADAIVTRISLDQNRTALGMKEALGVAPPCERPDSGHER